MTDQPSKPPPAEVLTLYGRFLDYLRAGNKQRAQELAPGVRIETEGWPYENETGPLNLGAFHGDPRDHRVLSWDQSGPDRYHLRSSAAYFTIERRHGQYVIVSGGLKPIE